MKQASQDQKLHFSKVPEDQWAPLWNFCNANGDGALSSDELVQCGKKAGDYLGMPDAHQNFLYDFAAKYWSAVDQDGSGKLLSYQIPSGFTSSVTQK